MAYLKYYSKLHVDFLEFRNFCVFFAKTNNLFFGGGVLELTLHKNIETILRILDPSLPHMSISIVSITTFCPFSQRKSSSLLSYFATSLLSKSLKRVILTFQLGMAGNSLMAWWISLVTVNASFLLWSCPSVSRIVSHIKQQSLSFCDHKCVHHL